MIHAVGDSLCELAELGLADAGYRSEDNLKRAAVELVVALVREGKEHAGVDAGQYPYTAATAAKLKTEQGHATYRQRILKFVNTVRPTRTAAAPQRGPLDLAFTAMQHMQDTIATLKLAAHPPDVVLTYGEMPAASSSSGGPTS